MVKITSIMLMKEVEINQQLQTGEEPEEEQTCNSQKEGLKGLFHSLGAKVMSR